MLLTLSAWPRIVKRHLRLFRSHSLQVLSIEQDATKSPQECQVQPQTEATNIEINYYQEREREERDFLKLLDLKSM